jgi:adenylate cyclase
MQFRIGVHLGEVRVEGERIYGDGVNIAARLEGLAEPGSVCVSATVLEQIENKLAVEVEDLGEQSLKNISRAVHAYRVRCEAGSSTPSAQTLPGMDELTVPGFRGAPAVAVLPFDNLSGDPEQEYFADGIAEDLITNLSVDRMFPIIARNSTFTYKGTPVDVKKVGRELGARYVVEGSVRKMAGRVRITAQLIDATTGHHLWAERFDRLLDDIFSVQDEITQAIHAHLRAEAHRAELTRAARARSGNLDAWECAMRATWHFNRFTKDDNARARALYQKAVELDPEWVWPHQAISVTHFNDLLRQWTRSPADSIAALVDEAKEAVKLDETDPMAQVAMGIAYSVTGDRKRMLAAFERATQLNPSHSLAHLFLGIWSASAGKPEQALTSLDTGMRLSPRDPYMFNYLYGVASAHFAAKRYDVAVDWARRSIESGPDNPIAHAILAASLAHLNRLDESRAALDGATSLQPGFSIAGVRLMLGTADPDYLERYLDGLRKAGLKE